MKIISTLMVVLFGASAFAGDGGFTNYTCTSNSGRTILNVFLDNYSGSRFPTTVRLTVDGQQIEYRPEIDFNGEVVGCEEECLNVHFDYERMLIEVNEGESILLSAKISNQGYIAPGFWDPRESTDFASSVNSKIQLSCKEFFQGP